MINRVIITGRLTKDPELKYTQSGVAVCRFTVAVNRAYKQEGGQDADFINCIAWRKQAENVANYLKKGSLCGVDGRIQTGSYEKDGQRIYTTEVIADSVQFLEPKSSNSSAQPNSSGGQAQQYNQPNQQNYTRNDNDPYATGNGPIDVLDDDLPF